MLLPRRYKKGQDRQYVMQLPPSIDEYVDENNPVRAIDIYVDTLDLEELDFTNAGGSLTRGNPAYDPRALLKLYLWGYLNRMRSSRRLEKEVYRNLEVIWLLEGLRPSYKTIADFRKDNAKALKAVNKDFIMVCRELGLFGGELVGIDSAFMEGDASKASVHTKKKMEKALARIEADINRYWQELEQGDTEEAGMEGEKGELKGKLAELENRQQTIQTQLEILDASGETQLSTTDGDARLLSKKTDKGPTVGFSVQIAVDDKNRLLAAMEVVNDGNDAHQLVPLAKMAKENLGVDEIEAAADGSYYTQQGIKECEDNGITPYVAIPDKSKAIREQGRFERADFHYDADTDTYTCPGGQPMEYRGRQNKEGKEMRKYAGKASTCNECPLREQCLPAKTPYRQVTRWEHEEVVERHQARMAERGKEYMRKRAGLAEHPFGTMKVWFGWTHFLVRGFDKVRGEMNLLMLCYNFKRVLNIIGLDAFRAYCQERGSCAQNPEVAVI